MRLKVIVKQLLDLKFWDDGLDYNALDASNRRIVAEGASEVKAI